MTWFDWGIIAGIIGLILLPRRFDPAFWLHQRFHGYQPKGPKEPPKRPPKGGTTGEKPLDWTKGYPIHPPKHLPPDDWGGFQ